MAGKKQTKLKTIRTNKSRAAANKVTVADNNIFCHPDTTKSQVVLVTPELKKLAAAYIGALHQCNIEFIEQELPDLCARFLRTDGAATALQKAKVFAAYIFKNEATSLNLPESAASENVRLPAQVLLPEIFSWPASDITDGTEDHDTKRGCDVEAAQLYLTIFEGTHFKRLALTARPEHNRERDQLLDSVKKAQACLLAYLRAMVKQARQHVIKISQNMEIEINGEEVEAKGAAKRALLALALMRSRKEFTTAEFSKVYYGPTHTQGEPASEFTTAIRDAKKLVPGLNYDSDNKGNRFVNGMHFIVEAGDTQIKQAISELLSAGK